MKISIKQVTPLVKFKDLNPGEMFVVDDSLCVKVHYQLCTNIRPAIRNSISLTGGNGVDLPYERLVQKVTSIQAEV